MKGISEVSKLTGVSRRTLQYYDDEGLLLVERSLNNHRIFDQQDLVRIWEVLVYKEIQFELKEIKNILHVSSDEQKVILLQRKEAIENKITKLKEQINLITWILDHGMPAPPTANSEKTYVESIIELRSLMSNGKK